ncbi:MAG: type I-G CRISPR-associated helicase/endonuclease Cas3g [Actinomycetota bacterium]
MTSFPAFPDFYREVNDRVPFPWQARLAEMVVTEGWPRMIGIPTGLGKSGCIDVAVWALASQASREPRQRSLPTRIWYVVNRRLLIDAAYEHGRELKDLLANPTKSRPSVAAVGEALLGMGAAGSEHGALHITRLRGGAELGARPPDPSQPALIFATVPMFASRWLFRGYGSSRSMRPVDAALAGIDSLVLLDEAHLARALAALNEPLQECDLGDPSLVLPAGRSRPKFVALTATGDVDKTALDLDADDLANPIVRKRVDALKPVSLVETTQKKMAGTLAEQAVSLISDRGEACACVVFTNTPKTAREVWSGIRGRENTLPRPVDLILATGRMRDREADDVRGRLLDPATGAAATRVRNTPRERDLVVVATQTLEVGADLDFDLFVSETPGTRALIQRLGRLNRLGESPHASGVVCHPSDVKEEWPVYGEEPAEVWRRLSAAAPDGSVDLGPGRVNKVLGDPSDEPERAGELLPVHLWEWAKTTLPPVGEAPVELFFQGFDDKARARVSVCWRAHRPKKDAVRLFPSVTEAESVEVPIWELREALEKREVEQVRRLASDRASLETASRGSIVPGDHLVLGLSDGLYDQYGWNTDSDAAVLDVSLFRSQILPLSVEALRGLSPEAASDAEARLLLEELAENGTGDEPLEPDEEQGLVEQLIDRLRAAPAHPWLSASEWADFLGALGTSIERPVEDVPYLASKPELRTRRGEIVGVRADAFEELSFHLDSRTLADHLSDVRETAKRMAAAVGCSNDLVETVALTGRLHDIGKADGRFQRWLDPDGHATELVAKSDVPRHRIEATRAASRWPRGGRHELLSARLIARWLEEDRSSEEDPALLMHLVLTHHGQGRPSVRIVADDDSLELDWQFDGVRATVPRTLSQHDWDQPRRFREMCARYGYWGLALLEACVRQADQAVSGARRVV